MFRWLTGLRVTLRSAIQRKRADEELDEELKYHLDREIDERVKSGLTPEEARYAALRAMGAIGKNRDECRDARGTRWLESLRQDFLYSFRLIKRSKGLALGVVISMGLGLGAAASLFSVSDFFAFRPLPVPETNRLVRIASSTVEHSVGSFSYPEYQDFVERSQNFSGIATYAMPLVGLATSPADQPRATFGMLVSGNFFSMMQIKPVIGRGFLPEEDAVPGRDAVAVISHRVWQQDFGSRADVIGREVEINGHPFTIVGVAPEWFLGVDQYVQPGIYFPRMMIQQVLQAATDKSALSDRSTRRANLFARLKPGVTVGQANEEIGRIASQLAADHPDTNKGVKAIVLTQFAFRTVDDPRLLRMGVLFLTVAFLVLGIACVNVSNLLLSTVPARTREMAVRVAMGASRARLLRQLLLESAILSGAGSIVGLAISSWWATFLSSIRLGASELVGGMQIQVDKRVVIFTLGAGVISGFVSGAIPAWRCSRSDLNSLLKSSDPRNQTHRTWGRQLLVGAQIAVASAFLVFSGFLLKSFQLAATQNPGFRVGHVLTMSFRASMAGYDVEKSHAFYTELAERLQGLPGVKSAAIAQDKPFGVFYNLTDLAIEGYELSGDQHSIEIRSEFVGEGYFETLDIPIIRGRAFDRRDGVNAPRTVIVNETMAQQYWPKRDPIGAHVEIKGDQGGPAEVIGIARNSKYGGMEEQPLPFLYRSYDQGRETYAALFVVTTGSPETLTSAVTTELRSIAPNMPVFDIRTMQDHVRENGLLEPRLGVRTFTPLSAVAWFLGVLGLYGVVAYSVGQRSYEIGIRMAVGATSRQVLRMVLLQGLRSSVIASAIGIILCLALRGIITNVASGVNSNDPTIYIAVFLLMLTVTGAACYIPARRASMVDPNVTLRN